MSERSLQSGRRFPGRCLRGRRAAAALAAALVVAAAAAASLREQLFPVRPAGPDLSPQNPTFFRFTRDPEVLCFLPGNQGEGLFQSSSPETGLPGPRALKELKCNGLVIVLDHPAYRLRAAGSATTAADRWWEALAGVVAAAPSQGHALDLRVTDSLLNRLRAAGDGSLQEFGRRLAGLLSSCGSRPLLSFEVSSPRRLRAAGQLRDMLRKEVPELRTGLVLTELPDSRPPRRAWDFVIADSEILPDWLQGQAAVSALHARLGPLPVILRFPHPDFYRDLVALATGAAGFQYAPPAKDGPRKRDLAFRHLRAFTTLKNRMRDGQIRLMPELAGPGILGALGVPGESYCLLLLRGAQVSFTPPLVEGRPDSLSWWYRAATDESIVLPRQARPAGSPPETLRLVPPSPEAAWIYCHEPLPARENWETTTPAVVSPISSPIALGL